MNFIQVAKKNRFPNVCFTCTCICEKQKHWQSRRKEPLDNGAGPCAGHVGRNLPSDTIIGTHVPEGSAELSPRRRPRIATVRGFRFRLRAVRYILLRFPVSSSDMWCRVSIRSPKECAHAPDLDHHEGSREQRSTSRRGSPESGTERIKSGRGWQRGRWARTGSDVPATGRAGGWS
jgi:hypothetical protein